MRTHIGMVKAASTHRLPEDDDLSHAAAGHAGVVQLLEKRLESINKIEISLLQSMRMSVA